MPFRRRVSDREIGGRFFTDLISSSVKVLSSFIVQKYGGFVLDIPTALESGVLNRKFKSWLFLKLICDQIKFTDYNKVDIKVKEPRYISKKLTICF